MQQAQAVGFQQLSARWSRVLGAATAATLGTAIDVCLEDLGQFTGVDVAFATLVDDDERVCDDWHWVRPGKRAVAPAVGSHLRDTFASATEFVRLGHIVAVDDLRELELSPSEEAIATANNLRAIVVVPVQVSAALIGIAGLLAFDEPRAWDKSTIQQMKLLSELLVRTVIRTRDRGALALADARARRISEFIPAGLVLVDTVGAINWVSPSFSRMADVRTNAMIGRRVIDGVHRDDHDLIRSAMQQCVVEATTARVRLLLGATWRWCDVSLRFVSEPQSGVPDEIVMSVHDAHERQLQAEELARASTRDALTGVANRAGLDRWFSDLGAQSAQIVVAYCDVDEFKRVNDRHGHDAGDRILRAIAKALRAAVRPDDIVARVGGDEFVVVVRDPGAPCEIAALAERMLSSVRAAVAGDNGVTVSIGVSGRASATEMTNLVRSADEAMYEAKRLGKDRFVSRANAFDLS